LLSGGKIETVRDGGEAPGTQIEVRVRSFAIAAAPEDFSRSGNTEAGTSIEHKLHAPRPTGASGRSPSCCADERVILQLPAAASLLDRICDLHGKDLVDPSFSTSKTEEYPRKFGFRGLIGQAGVSRQNARAAACLRERAAHRKPGADGCASGGLSHRADERAVPVTFFVSSISFRRRWM